MMKNVTQWITILLLCIQTIGYAQTKQLETSSEKREVITVKQKVNANIDMETFKNFIGTYFLAEADFELEIVAEDNKMYIISPFSKDILIQKNESTLREPTRGVDLERIANNKNALKFTQNGYETVIERVAVQNEN
ncbi:hypothetical protein [Spongiimicrobium salis]|uniref:hypothetical protein n=1 Tax=Spongiimicrobium salis TaxID=1667022 RepID=UPI00374D37A6